MTKQIDVIFRMLDGEVIALMPGHAGDSNPNTCSSYMHVGQHSAASVYLRGKLATPEQYQPLLNELQAKYVGKIRVIKRATRKHYLARCQQISNTR